MNRFHKQAECGNAQGAMRGAYLNLVSYLVHRESLRSPARMARFLRYVSAKMRVQIGILRILALPEFRSAVGANPRFAIKYFWDGYLVRGFTVIQRKCSFFHHYRRLHEEMSSSFLHKMFSRSVVVLEACKGESCFEITMGLSPEETEGELSLILQVDGVTVFFLSFTIVPGWVVHSGAGEVLLITRLQGLRERSRQVAAATRAFHQVGPEALLLAVLQGFAEAFGVYELACVSAAHHTALREDSLADLKVAYDDFFAARGAVKNEADFFVCPIPLPQKPLSEIKKGHKLRTRTKRAFKCQIAEGVCRFLVECRSATGDVSPYRVGSLSSEPLERQSAGEKAISSALPERLGGWSGSEEAAEAG
jgi:hypothetical protein